IPATIVNTAYVQEDYWLLVQAPDDVAGAETGEFYDLTVSLGSQTDTELSSILYVEQTQDVSIVLDHSGSMGGGTGKIEAAQNAAVMLVDELADDDQGAYIAFDTNANLRESLDTVGSGSQRIDLLLDIANEVPAAATSIGDGMALAASDMAANKIDTHMCSYVLLSDGMENEPQYWADVVDDVVDTGCAIHTIALGPSANQELMQQIAGSSPAGGSYYYATNTGSVPVNSVIGWQNNLSRLYDAISIDVAGRQRIVTAIRESALGGAMSGVVEFDDLARGTLVVVG
ncbi:MAG: VWA domain-containing protein, partial [Planctomycetales bacterium]|nr:VWA domain-containing protein [Planctomycetales bacterium]